MPSWFAICDKATGLPISYATDDSQGFQQNQLAVKFDVFPITKQPAVDEVFDTQTKSVKVSK